jgi:hypothetical protein
MFHRISHATPLLDPSIIEVQKFLAKTLLDHDIGAQATCHMFQKLPLTISIRPFFSLNVNHKIYRLISPENNTSFPTTNFIDPYLFHPCLL